MLEQAIGLLLKPYHGTESFVRPDEPER